MLLSSQILPQLMNDHIHESFSLVYLASFQVGICHIAPKQDIILMNRTQLFSDRSISPSETYTISSYWSFWASNSAKTSR